MIRGRRRDLKVTVTACPPESVGSMGKCGLNYTINQGIFIFPRGAFCGKVRKLNKTINGEWFLI